MSERLWRTPAGRELRWRSWDGEHLAYHANSGDTHRLNAVSWAVLHAIRDESLATEQIVERVARALDSDPQTLRDPIRELLARLEDLGLVESCDDSRPGSHTSRAR